jgi:hypothetical protein
MLCGEHKRGQTNHLTLLAFGCSGNHINFATNPITLHAGKMSSSSSSIYFLCLTVKGKER